MNLIKGEGWRGPDSQLIQLLNPRLHKTWAKYSVIYNFESEMSATNNGMPLLSKTAVAYILKKIGNFHNLQKLIF